MICVIVSVRGYSCKHPERAFSFCIDGGEQSLVNGKGRRTYGILLGEKTADAVRVCGCVLHVRVDKISPMEPANGGFFVPTLLYRATGPANVGRRHRSFELFLNTITRPPSTWLNLSQVPRFALL